ncbi:MAG: hypothetical protein ABI874_12235 [Chloroflexota bacterium]
MPQFPSVFPVWWIAVTALIAAIVSWIVLRWRFTTINTREQIIIALVVGVSVLAWRASGNVPLLNDDPVSALSPNDWLCPIVTYVFLGVYAAFRRPADLARWEQTRALLTIVSFVVNVVTI